MLISSAPGALAWPAALIVWGPGYTSAGHSHHCVQLVMTMRGTLRIRAAPGQRWIKCGAALIQPDAAHEVDGRGSTVLIAFVDPESELGAALSERAKQGITVISARRVARWRSALGSTDALPGALVDRWARNELLRQRRAPRIHPGVRLVLRHLPEKLGTLDEVSLPKLAATAGLSESRFMHVFTKSTGVALRPYILWLRLQRAAGELAAGTSITEAAHRAGFSDASHLTRTFRRMLGTTPREITGRNRATAGISIHSDSG